MGLGDGIALGAKWCVLSRISEDTYRLPLEEFAPGARDMGENGVCPHFPHHCTGLIPSALSLPSPLGEGGRRPDEGANARDHRDLPLTLALSQGRGKAPRRTKSRKLILPLAGPWDTACGFRDGRHELSHLCPETSGACPRLGSDIPMLRQGVRPGRGALNDRPHLPDALESGWRQPGKTPQAGCRGHHGHRRPATRTPRCPPASRFLPPPPQSRAEPQVRAEVG